MLKFVLVAHLTYENQWNKLPTKIQTFGFFWDTLLRGIHHLRQVQFGEKIGPQGSQSVTNKVSISKYFGPKQSGQTCVRFHL